MDDPTRRCENDTDNETHSPRPPIPSGGLIFWCRTDIPVCLCLPLLDLEEPSE
jgi:hypothetical protein